METSHQLPSGWLNVPQYIRKFQITCSRASNSHQLNIKDRLALLCSYQTQLRSCRKSTPAHNDQSRYLMMNYVTRSRFPTLQRCQRRNKCSARPRTLDPKEIQCSCQYRKTAESDPKPPEYRNEFNCGRKYQPSHNIAPTDISPVLVSATHFNEEKDSSERLIVPMMWSMVPRWHTGDYRKHGLTTNNCRLENLAVSKLYGPPLQAGQRCVILCEGFYEWQTTKSLKASDRPAFYIHMPQNDNVKMDDKATWNLNNDGIKLLKMAGLFDLWQDDNGDKLYSYTVITFESNKKFADIHHRIPAILETEEEVTAWLDFRRVQANRAMNMLKPSETIEWYAVSNLVNNSRNKSDQCNKPIEQVKSVAKGPATPKSKLMQSWLIVKKRKSGEFDVKKEDTVEGEPKEKKVKLENMENDTFGKK